MPQREAEALRVLMEHQRPRALAGHNSAFSSAPQDRPWVITGRRDPISSPLCLEQTENRNEDLVNKHALTYQEASCLIYTRDKTFLKKCIRCH